MRASPDDVVGMILFARVVEGRSFTDAARALGMSKSAVSARVARLEERLGVRLLHRTTRRVALTADGVRFYEQCARVVADADQAAEVAAGASAKPRGTLRVHASTALAEPHLPMLLARFVAANPEVRIELRLDDRPPDASALGFDVALVVARRLADSGLTVRKVASSRGMLVAAPAYLRKHGIPYRPQDLVHHDCLVHRSLQGEDWRFETEEGIVTMTGKATLAVDDARLLRGAAISGLGITIVPELLVAQDLAEGRLLPVLVEATKLDFSVSVVHPHAHLAPASVRAFVDHVAAYGKELRADVAAPEPPPRTRPKAGRKVPMTAQDVDRLRALAALYTETDPASARALAELVARAQVAPAATFPADAVTMNSKVRCTSDRRGERELWLVYPWDERADGVSVLSPLGLELLGASVGAKLTAGGERVRVSALLYQPEAAGDHHL